MQITAYSDSQKNGFGFYMNPSGIRFYKYVNGTANFVWSK